MPSERRARRGLPQDSRTASGAPANNSATLAEFDLHQLELYRQLTEKHLTVAMNQAVTAAADPQQFIQEYFITEFMDTAYATWSDVRGLVGALFGDLPTPLLQSTIVNAVNESGQAYRELLDALINSKVFGVSKPPIYGEFVQAQDPKSVISVVQPGDVRPLMAKLSGGYGDVTIPLTGSITGGQTLTNWLRSNDITTDKKIWLYGESRRPFNGHQQIDGLVFEHWDDEGLKIAPQDAWIRRRYYAVGDHWGCGCIAAPYFPNYGDAFELNTPTV